MASDRSTAVYPNLRRWSKSVAQIIKEYSAVEVRSMYHMYCLLCEHYNQSYDQFGLLCMKDFLMHTFGMTQCVTTESIQNFFKLDSLQISAFHFIKSMALITRGTLREKTVFTFMAFSPDLVPLDQNKVRALLEKQSKLGDSNDFFFITDPFTDLLQSTFDLFDRNRDKHICLDDFGKTIEAQPLLINSLGEVIPNEKYIRAFDLGLNFDSYTPRTHLSEEDWEVYLPAQMRSKDLAQS